MLLTEVHNTGTLIVTEVHCHCVQYSLTLVGPQICGL